MRRADRLFDIIQTLRSATKPLTAIALAKQLEVTKRTIYRDIATLQARRIPIEGAVGVGYVLHRDYDLPPLNFTVDEIEALSVGARMVQRLKDKALQSASETALSKLTVAMPDDVRQSLVAPRFWVSEGSACRPKGINLGDVRAAIRSSRKLRIAYFDDHGKCTRRTIWPIAMVYYVDASLVAAWCEKRTDFRHFRVERIKSCTALDEHFDQSGDQLMNKWLAVRELSSY